DHYNSPHCYILQNDMMQKDVVIHYAGHAKDILTAASVRLLESGFIAKSYETRAYVQESQFWRYTREEEIKKQDEANIPVPFKLSEWKVASLFAGLASGLIMTTL